MFWVYGFWFLEKTFEKEIINSPRLQPRGWINDEIFVPMALAILQKVLGLRFLVLGKTFEKEIINSPGLQPWDWK
jgi:hypothetical protein